MPSSGSKFATDRFLGHRKPYRQGFRETDDDLRASVDKCAKEIARISAEVDQLSKSLSQVHNKTPSHHLILIIPSIGGFLALLAIAFFYGTIVTIVTNCILRIVDDRLLLYAKDRTGMRNYAHAFNGADIINPLTSSTFISSDSPTEAVAWQPEVVISPGLEVGRCWSFAGSNGHVGITLADEIVVTNVTIEHIAPALGANANTAPRNMTLWGYVENTALLERYMTHLRNDHFLSTTFPVSSAAMPTKMNISSFIPLVSFSYNPHATNFLQTFTVPHDYVSISVPVRHVVLHVQTNWGSLIQTCIYRVRIHGTHLE